jgi:hypothetical protein
MLQSDAPKLRLAVEALVLPEFGESLFKGSHCEAAGEKLQTTALNL